MPKNYPALTPVSVALQELLAAVEPLSAQSRVTLNDGLGRVIATTHNAGINVPPADNSAMDGYAIRCADINPDGETRLHISQRICAGETGQALQNGTAARIFTGAPIPENADAVVMQEHCQVDNETLIVSRAVKQGQNIRRAGEDIRAGDDLLSAGTYLRAQELGLAASVGIGHLNVYPRLKVATFTTGNELIDPTTDTDLDAGKIYDSNRYSLMGLLKTLGCDIVDLGRVEDTLSATKQALQDAAEQADIVITTGGVSVGEEDHIRNALEQLGQLNLWRIAVKPGKPLAFGHINATPFVGLPGNPVSAFVTFAVFVAPMIKKMQGRTDIKPHAYQLPAAFTWTKAGFRQEYIRARLLIQDGISQVESYPHQGSGVLSSVSWSDGLVEIPVDATIAKGDMINFYPYSELLT